MYLLIGIVVLVFLIMSLVALKYFLDDFLQELKFLNTEIHGTTGEEQKHWLRKRRRLWLSILPFVKY